MSTKYVPLLELGRGPLGVSFLCVMHGVAGHYCLLTYLRFDAELTRGGEASARFLDELQCAVAMNHPQVVQTFELGRDGDEYYLLSEYLDGLSLEALFERGGRSIATEAYVRVLGEVLTGLHYAHELRDERGEPLGLVHGDVAAASVVVTCSGEAKVLDFGRARATAASGARSRGVEQKIANLAPEQARGALEAAERGVDIFAVGVLLFRALAGRPLWAGQSVLEILEHLVAGRIPSVRAAAPGAPAELVAICDRALAPRPADRYPTALAFQKALEGYLERSGAGLTREQIGAIVAGLSEGERAKISEALQAYLATRPEVDAPLSSGPPVYFQSFDGAAEPPGHPYRGSGRAPTGSATAPAGDASARARGVAVLAIVVIAIAAAWLAR